MKKTPQSKRPGDKYFPKKGNVAKHGTAKHPAPKRSDPKRAPNNAGANGSAGARAQGLSLAHDAMGAPIRPERGSYFLYGYHAVSAALANPSRRLGRFWGTRAATEKLGEALQVRDIQPRAADRATFDLLLGEQAVHQGLILEVWPLKEATLDGILAKATVGARIILLDQVTDPHNVGAILRTAAIFGVDAVCLQARNAPPESASLAKTASGALEHVPLVRIGNVTQSMALMKEHGFWIAGLAGESDRPVSDLGSVEKLAITMGAEGEGLRRLTRERCDLLVQIPMAGTEGSEAIGSLNVSNAAAIALYAARRTS